MSNTRFFVDVQGAYIGGFGDGARPDDPNATEVMVPPNNGRDVWDFDAQAWTTPAPDPSVARAGIDAERDRRLKVVAGSYTQAERETWPVQVNEATALQSDPEAPTPMLRGIVGPDGDVAVLAARVLALSAAFAAATGAIMGAASRLKAMDPLPEDYTDDKWWSP